MKKILCMFVTLVMLCSFALAKDVTVPLTIYDRITLSNMLPRAGDILTAITINDLRNKLVLTQEEIEEYEVETLPGGRIQWAPEAKDYKVKTALTTAERKLLSGAMKKANKEKKVKANDAFIRLYNMVMDLEVVEETK